MDDMSVAEVSARFYAQVLFEATVSDEPPDPDSALGILMAWEKRRAVTVADVFAAHREAARRRARGGPGTPRAEPL